MNVPGGYKLTEVGVIPEDWELVPFEKIYLEPPRNGLSRPQNVRGLGYKMINMGELFAYSQISNQDMERVEMSRSEISRFCLIVNDLLFARQSLVASGVGKCSIFEGNSEIVTFESHIIRVRLNQKIAHSRFYYHIFNSNFGSKRVRSLITQIAAAGIKGSELAKLELPLPPLPEQEAIALVLSDADALITSLDKLIAKKRDIKQAAMQQLLTGKQQLEGFGDSSSKFKQTEIGLIPEDWEVSHLKDLVDPNRKITYGIVVPGLNIPNGIPMIRAQDYSKGWVDLEMLYRVSSRIDKAYKRSRIITNDLLLTIVGSVGNLAKVPFAFNGSNITQQTARLSFNKKVVDTDFYFNILQSKFGQKEIFNYTKSGVQPSLNLSDVDKFLVPYPPLSEQQAIAKVLSDMDSEISALEQRRDKTKALKQAMMQELLTGKTRLK
jgi:type I restriction enzyme S subunit